MSELSLYHRRKHGTGEHARMEDRASKAAEYLDTFQWGRTDQERAERRARHWENGRIVRGDKWYETETITMEELLWVIKKIKRRRAPGPDEISTGISKEFGPEGKVLVFELFNRWNNEEVPEEMFRARVVLIYKKGNTSKYENYRPISLLNTLYKIFTAILQKRISEKMDKRLQKTQTLGVHAQVL